MVGNFGKRYLDTVLGEAGREAKLAYSLKTDQEVVLFSKQRYQPGIGT